jgi:hypothetical protein
MGCDFSLFTIPVLGETIATNKLGHAMRSATQNVLVQSSFGACYVRESRVDAGALRLSDYDEDFAEYVKRLTALVWCGINTTKH